MTALAAPIERRRRRIALGAVIADARRRQRRRRTGLAVLAAASTLLLVQLEGAPGPATPAVGRSTAVRLPAACSLLGNALVAKILQGRMAYKSAQTGPRACTWAGYPFPRQFGQKRIDVAIARISDTEFASSASYSLVPGQADGVLVRKRSQPIHQLGDSAYWDAHTDELAVLYDGTVIYIDSTLLANPLAREETVARTVIARLRRQRSET